MRARSFPLLAALPLLAACGAEPVPPVDAGRADVPGVDVPGVDVPGVDVPGVDVPGVDVPGVDVPTIDVPVVDRPVVDAARVDAPAPVDVGVDVPPADVPPLPPGRVSVEMGGATAIALDRDGQPSIAYGSQQGAMVRLVVSTRAGTGWTHETADTLPTAVSRVGYAIDPAGARHLGYAQYISRSGVGYSFRFFAATRAAGPWTTRLLADHAVNHNTAVRPDIHVTAAGAVHVAVPLTPATGIASRVRHLALEGGAVLDEELAPRVSGSSSGVAIGRIAAAIHGDAPLTLFTVADDGFGSDTVAHLSTRSGSAMVATAIGAFPDLGSSLTEVWGADVFRLAGGYVTVTADASGRFGDTTRYRVFRQGAASTWTMNTVGPVRYGADNWCAAPFADGTVALFVYAGVGMPVTATELRLILVRPDGTSVERSVDANVEGGLFCSAVTDATTVHVAYRKPDGGIYYQRLPR